VYGPGVDQKEGESAMQKTCITLAVLALACAAGAAWWFTPPNPPPAIVMLGPAPTLSVIQAGDERAAKPVPSPVAAAPQPVPRPELHPLAEEFKRLTAPGATPAMLSQAFDMAKDCRNQSSNLAQGVSPPPMRAKQYCKLAPGQYEDAALQRRMIEARVARNDFGAVVDVSLARSDAFADDPAAWRRLKAEAARKGREEGEPVAMAGEFTAEYERAGALQANGQYAEAAAAYRQAAVYAIAGAINLAKENGQAPPDLSQDRSVKQAMNKVPAAQQLAVINEGRELAAKWRRS
jgi:hypothetical protein